MVREVSASKILTDGRTETVQLTIDMEEFIGCGVFSNVYKAELSKPENRKVAIKKTWPEPEYKQRHKEIHLLLYNHPHVCNLLYYFTTKHINHETACWNLVLEYSPTNVRKMEEASETSGTPISAFNIKLWSYQMFCGLAFIHSKNVCHRDIKPDNMLLDPETGLLQIGDLGSAKILKENQSSEAYQVTRYYRAPELILGNRKYGVKIDNWAAGCLVAGLALGEVLFAGDNNDDQMNKITQVLGTPTHEQTMAMYPFSSKRKWHDYAKKEWSEVLADNEKELIHLISKIIVYEPDKRYSALEACRHSYFDQLRNPDTRMPDGKPLPIEREMLTNPEMKPINEEKKEEEDRKVKSPQNKAKRKLTKDNASSRHPTQATQSAETSTDQRGKEDNKVSRQSSKKRRDPTQIAQRHKETDKKKRNASIVSKRKRKKKKKQNRNKNNDK